MGGTAETGVIRADAPMRFDYTMVLGRITFLFESMGRTSRAPAPDGGEEEESVLLVFLSDGKKRQ